MTSLARNPVDRSANALGLGFNQWTRNDLSLILSHYGVHLGVEESKNSLIDKLNQLALKRGLTRADRLAFLTAYKAGRRLPPRKHLLSPPIASATVPRIASVPSDGSDTDNSDGEDTEELPTLSEEERDLREYTSSMNLPQGSHNRTLRPRSTAYKTGHRLVPADRPLMEDRRGTVNGNASTRPSNPATVKRAATTTHFLSNSLARPRTVKPAPTSQRGTEPSTPQIIHATNHECLICYDSFDTVKTPMRQPTSTCEHEVNICTSCLSASISSQLETKLWTRISCPASACDKLLGYDDVQEFAEPRIFAR